MGSVLSTILATALGFATVLLTALALDLLALAVLRTMLSRTPAALPAIT